MNDLATAPRVPPSISLKTAPAFDLAAGQTADETSDETAGGTAGGPVRTPSEAVAP